MEHTVLVVVALVALLLLHHQELLAAAAAEEGANNSSSSIHGDGLLAVDASHLFIMQFVRAHHARRFSYCLRADPGHRHGMVRLDGEVPSTRGMARAPLLYNAEHAWDYGPYFVDLAGVSVDGALLPGLNANTFRRNAADGSGGTVLDVSTPMLVMVQAAYDALEHAVAAYLGHNMPRVQRPGFTFCVRGGQQFWPTVKLHFPLSPAVVTLPPSKLFVTFEDQVACLAVLPGDRTFIGALPQVDTRFTFDLDANAVFIRPENCQRNTAATTN